MWLADCTSNDFLRRKNNDFLRRKNNDELANDSNVLMVCMFLIQFLLAIFRV
jgi:hypothetical protein